MKAVESSFVSKGDRCAGTLCLPDGETRPPVMVMAHGFGAIRVAGLLPFAARFAAAGYAVFLFDYRGFGDSGGEPRQWVSVRRQLQDWRAALAYVRTLPEVDGRRLALWGTSFSGGHVLRTAADDPEVGAVVAQVPHISGLATVRQIPLALLGRLGLAGLRDLVGGWFGRPSFAAIVGRPGDVAAMSAPGAWDGYLALFPKHARWENRTRARIFLELPLYSPVRHVHRIAAPTLLVAGRQDSITPARSARQAAQRIPQGRFKLLESDHFQPYLGATFEENIALQLRFLRQALPPS